VGIDADLLAFRAAVGRVERWAARGSVSAGLYGDGWLDGEEGEERKAGAESDKLECPRQTWLCWCL
jgi:hypothetical protein